MISDYYTTDFDIYRVSHSVDADNFEIVTSSLSFSGRGFFEPLTGAEIVVSEKYESRTTHRLFCNVLNIIDTDTIKISSNDYNIDLIQNFQNDHLELTLIRRK